jgi:LPXTG-site transpeptidase (sortase) family protein
MNQEPIINFNEAEKLFQKEETANTNPNPQPIAANKYPVPEHHIEEPRSDQYGNQKPLWKTILFWIVVIVIAFLIGFFILNAPALLKKVGYWFNKGTVNEQIFTPIATVSDTATTVSDTTLPDNHIIIPSINVDIPVIWNVEPSQADTKMLDGAIQYSTSALPSQQEGNVFITAHSSNYWWIKSSYNQAFALLPEIKINDKIILTYQKTKYVYQVYDQFTVSANDVSVTEAIPGKSTLTLMTCVPIGTNFKRLIVRSELLYADSNPSASTQTTSTEPQATSTPVISNTAQPVNVTPTPASTSPSPVQTTTKTDVLLPSVP